MSSPSSRTIEITIRGIIAGLYRQGNLDDLTVKRVRIAAEQELSLPPGWFKTHDEWKDKSKSFIEEEAQRQAKAQDGNEEAEMSTQDASQEDALNANTKKQRTKKRSSADIDLAPRKKQKSNKSEFPATKSAPKHRTSKAASRKAKRTVVDSDDEGDSVPSEVEQDDSVHEDSEDYEVQSNRLDQKSESEMSVLIDDDPPPTKKGKRQKTPPKMKTTTQQGATKKVETMVDDQDPGDPEEVANENDSDSAMSSLIDDVPAKGKQGGKVKSSRDSKAKSKSKSTKNADIDPQALEIKKLKEWLAKCGIRKMWYKELAPYDTQKKQIAHLKDMLKDAGMDGRPSIAKANEIRERRELAEELDEAQKFAQRWGKAEKRDQPRSAADAMADIGFELDDESD